MSNYILTYDGKYVKEDELYHYGVPGMKWGHRKASYGTSKPNGKKIYRSKGLRSLIAKKQNEKIDKSFAEWTENSKKRENAINLGKKANISKMSYEKDKSKENKKQYKSDNKAYKKALKGNTTYRKGQIKNAVGKDLSRKYLSEAKKIKKSMSANSEDKTLNKQYNTMMNKYGIARAKARRAPEVAENRSRRKAAIKRGITMSVKAAATSAAIGTGIWAANRYLSNHNVTLNGTPIRINGEHAGKIRKAIQAGKEVLKYF